MNKIFKLKFNKRLSELVVVSELANNAVAETSGNTSPSLLENSLLKISKLFNKSLLASSLILAGLFSSFSLNANANAEIYGTHNQLGNVIAGAANSVTNGSVTTIYNDPNTIIEWNKFNINKDEILNFVQKSADSAILNRVVGGGVSQILGLLQSNGNVFVVNPNGIIFGKNARINVAGLVASSLDIKNDDFLHGHYVFNQAKDAAIAKVLNSGVIKVNDDGSVALIGGQVVNNGVLEAKNGTVFLLAGNSIEIADLHNPLVSYKVTAENKAINLNKVLGNQVVLLGNKVLNGRDDKNFSSFAEVLGDNTDVATKATIDAKGSVVLYGGSESDSLQSTDQTEKQVQGTRNSFVENNATINVSSQVKAGSVKVLGDVVYTGKDSKILAQGLDAANGGEVLIGGDAKGNGAVKLAALDLATENSLVDVSAKSGNAGHIVFWGNDTKVDGRLNATSETGKGGFIETSGVSFNVGKHLKVNTGSFYHVNDKNYTGTWLIDPDWFAVVGNESDFEKIKLDLNPKANKKYNKKPAKVDKGTTFNNSNLHINSGKFDYSKNGHITQDDLRTVLGSSTSLVIEARHGVLFYNVTGNVSDNLTSLTIDLTNQAKNKVNGVPEIESGFKETKITNKNLDINLGKTDKSIRAFYLYNSSLDIKNLNVNVSDEFQATNSSVTANAINVKSGSDKDKGSIAINNGSNFTANTGDLELNATDTVTIDNSKLTSQLANVSVNSTSNVILVQDSNITVVKGDVKLNSASETNLSNAYITVSNGKADLLSSWDVHLENSSVTSNKALNVNSDIFVNLNNSNLTSTDDKVTVLSYSAIKLPNSNISGKQGVSLNSSAFSILSLGEGKAKITSENGAVTLNAAVDITLENISISANDDVALTVYAEGEDVKDEKDLNLRNNVDLVSKVGNVNLTATTGTLYVQNSNISNSHEVNLKSGTNVILSNANISAQTVKAYTSNGRIEARNTTNLTVTETLNITSFDIVVNNSKAEAHAIELNAKTGTVNVTDSNLTSTTDQVQVKAIKDITLTNSNISGTKGVIVDSSNNITATNSNLTTYGATVEVKALNNVTLDNSNISSANTNITSVNANVNIKATNNEVSLSNANISAHNTLNITATNVSLANSEAKAQNILLNATSDTVNVTNSNLTSTVEKVEVKAVNNVTLDNSNVSAKTDVVLTADKVNVNVTNSSLKSESTNVNITATLGNVSETNTNITSVKGNINLKADKNNLTLSNANVSAYNTLNVTATNINVDNSKVKTEVEDIKLNATDGKVSVTDSNLTSARDVDVKATGDITFGNSNTSAGNDVVLNGTADKAKETKVELTYSNVTAESGKVELLSKFYTHLANSSIEAGKAVNVNGDSTFVFVQNSNLTSTNDKVVVNAESAVNFTNSNISGKQGVSFDSNDKLSYAGVGKSKITSDNGAVIFNSDEDVLLENISIKANDDISLIAKTKDLELRNNVELESKNAKVSVVGANNVISTNSKVSAKDDIIVSSTGQDPKSTQKVELTKSILSSAEKNVNITSVAGNVTATDTNITSVQGTINLKSDKNNVALSNANVSAKTDVVLSANNVNVTAGILKSESENVNVTATAGNVTVKLANISSTKDVNLKADNNVTLSNANISAHNVTAQATKGTFEAKAKTNVTVTETLNLTAANVVVNNSKAQANNVELNATAGTVNVTDSNLSATTDAVLVKAVKDITLTNSNVTGTKALTLDAQDNVKVTDSNLTSTTDAVLVKALNNVDLDNSNISAISTNITSVKGNVNIKSDNNNVTLSNANVSAYNSLNVTAANITITDSKVQAHDIELNATSDAVKVTNSNLTSTGENVEVKAVNNVTLDSSNVSAKTDLVLLSDKYEVNVTSSILKSESANVNLTANHNSVTVQDTNISAAQDVNLKSEYNVTLSNANISAHNVTVQSGIYLEVINSKYLACDVAYKTNGAKNIDSATKITIKDCQAKTETKSTTDSSSTSIPLIVDYSDHLGTMEADTYIANLIGYNDNHKGLDNDISKINSYVITNYLESEVYSAKVCSTKIPQILKDYGIPFGDIGNPDLKAKYKVSDADYQAISGCNGSGASN